MGFIWFRALLTFRVKLLGCRFFLKGFGFRPYTWGSTNLCPVLGAIPNNTEVISYFCAGFGVASKV